MKSKRQIKVTVRGTNKGHVLLQQLLNKNVRLKQVKYDKQNMQFWMMHKDLSTLRKVNRIAKAKIFIEYAQPKKVIRPDFRTFIGLLLLIFVPFLCAQFIWQVNVQHEFPEVQKEIELQLQQLVQTPTYKKNMLQDTTLRQQLMSEQKQLAWLHIIHEGSKIRIIPMLAPKAIEQQQETVPSHLIAANGGIITHFDLERGVRLVEKNMTVYKGDPLVSGIVMEGEQAHVVGAKGAVFADYWLETSFSLPTTITVQSLENMKWKLTSKPNINYRSITLWKNHYYLVNELQTVKKQIQLTEDHVQTILMPLLHMKILQTLPQKSTIKSQNILQVTFDNDTVKGKVLFLINENIATTHPIAQGE